MNGGSSQSSSSSSWLCPTELDRARVIDASDRVRTIRRVGSGAVGLALLAVAPWIGWWTLGLLALCALNFANVERRIRTSPRPERVSAWAIVITLGLIGVGVAISGGPHSPALPWMVLPARDGRRALSPPGRGRCARADDRRDRHRHARRGPRGDDRRSRSDVIATLALLAGVVSIVWALQSAELHHRDEAILDPLTGLLNRHALVPRFVEISLQARLTGQPVSLVLCDVDGFKEINDEHGHDRGDAVLRDIAYELRKRLRSFELVYRLGGEEFLIVLPGIGLRRRRRHGRAAARGGRAGATEGHPRDDLTRRQLRRRRRGGLRRAVSGSRQALYEAKREGRNRVVAAAGPDQVDGLGEVPGLPAIEDLHGTEALRDESDPAFAAQFVE